MDTQTKSRINGIVRGLKEYPEVMAVILFGSRARKRTTPMSDVDIAVIVGEGCRDIKGIESEISGFSSNVFDVVNFHRLPLYIQFEVLKHGKPLFVKDKGYFLKVKREVLRGYLEMSSFYERMSRGVLAA